MYWFARCLFAVMTVATTAAAAPIHDAAKIGDVAAIIEALDAGAGVDESDGWATPLWYAARRGQEDAAKLLIARGADANLATKTSGPPLLGAIERKNCILVKLLIANGADPNAALATNSALYLAARSGCLECVKALVDAGAEVNALNKDREPPIHAAKLIGLKEIAGYLAEHGAQSPVVAPIADKLGAADLAMGKAVYDENCAHCHHIDPKKGSYPAPNLWGVVSRQKASIEDYSYSETLRSWGASWSYEDLNAFFWGPKIILPGVRMQFAGLENEAERANLIAYLRTQSDEPAPLP